MKKLYKFCSKKTPLLAKLVFMVGFKQYHSWPSIILGLLEKANLISLLQSVKSAFSVELPSTTTPIVIPSHE
jgi:hypothetical protein